MVASGIGVRVWSVAVAAGVAAALAPPQPTGSPVVDALFLAAGTAIVVLVGAMAPWWVVGVVAGTALAIAADPVLMLPAALALGASLWVGATGRHRPDVLAAAVGVALNVFARAELDAGFGTSAMISLSAIVMLLLAGFACGTRMVRRVALIGAGALVVAGGVATLGFGAAAAQSREELAAGVRSAEQGVTSLENGTFDDAERWFREASSYLASANERMAKPWTSAAALVPVVAQHRSAVLDMSGVGAEGAATVADALAEIDLDALRTVDGHFDLDALAGLEGPLSRVRDALMDLQQTTDAARSPWLVNRAMRELDDFDTSIDEHLPALESSLQAIDLAPAMLGADEPRTYLVLFTTPSESRGLGGFIGSYAELTAEDGQLTLDNFGRAQDLDAAANEASARVTGHEAFLHQYGRFGYGEDGSVGDAAFRNLAMSPDFPTVAEIAADLYAQTTGRQVDGVVAMDPFVVSALLRYVGTIELSTVGLEVDADSVLPYLLLDQYVVNEGDTETRVDALAEAASLTFDALLAGALPDPITLSRDLGPLTRERRLLVWSADPEEQALLERVHVAGAIPDVSGSDGWAVTVSNGGGSKIDHFLQRRASYQAATDADGEATATLRLELTNNAPAEGYPPYVIGNLVGLPSGTSRLYVSFYSPLALTGATLDGEAMGLTVGEEEGWNVYSGFVDIPPGESVTFDVQLAGSVADPDTVVTWVQPLSSPLEAL
jgi:hypothetical protein